jgi:hypothetical protein
MLHALFPSVCLYARLRVCVCVCVCVCVYVCVCCARVYAGACKHHTGRGEGGRRRGMEEAAERQLGGQGCREEGVREGKEHRGRSSRGYLIKLQYL